ncbi:MAG: hypothetical protein ACXACF_05305 [Candidatus Hermodarchaeia archaeon]|jgi:hypothetical protein
MSKNGFWEDISNSKFFTIIIVLVAFLLGITALATFNGTLLTIGAALILSFVMPLLIYFRIWPKYKMIARVVFSFCFLVMNDSIISYFLQQGTSYPMYFLALIEYFIALVLVMSVAALLYERYLRPKLESTRVKKVETYSLVHCLMSKSIVLAVNQKRIGVNSSPPIFVGKRGTEDADGD